MSKLTSKFWDNVAFLYTAFMKHNDACFVAISHEIAQYLSNDMNMLELACGTGQLTFKLAPCVNSLIATDFSPKMIMRARKNGIAPNVSFCEADATNLKFKDNSFDAVIISNALHIMPDPDAALKEIHRVLKPDGFMAAPTFVFDQGFNRFKLWFMEKIGFNPYHKWTADELAQYVANRNFKVLSKKCIKGDPAFECVICAQAL